MSINACGTCCHDVEHDGKPSCAVVRSVLDATAERIERERWNISEWGLPEEEKHERYVKFVEGVAPGYHAMQEWMRSQRWNPDALPIDPVESCPTWKERT